MLLQNAGKDLQDYTTWKRKIHMDAAYAAISVRRYSPAKYFKSSTTLHNKVKVK
jgi:hypothetical protein